MDFLANWMQSTWINALIIENNGWIWPFLETWHFFGMCLLFGAVMVMDLRLIGWTKAAAILETDKLASMAMTGFGINLFTGLLFCFGDPHRYAVNISFQIKVALIILAGLNFLFYKSRIEPLVTNVGPGEPTPAIAKFCGGASLLLWLGVLSYGRLIAYLGPG